MDPEVAFSPEIIEIIHSRSRQYIEIAQKDEIDFFDDIWEIFDEQLRKWLNKPPRKWRFKTSKLKVPNFSSISGDSDALALVTPKILEVVSLSYAQIITLKEHSLESIEKIIKKNCGRKLPYSVILQAVGFFAPLIIRDLKNIGGTHDYENWEEFKLPASISQGRKEYILYSHEFPEGKKISAAEYSQEKVNFNFMKKEFFIFLNEKNDEFYVYGNPQLVPDSAKELLKFLLKSVNCTLDHDFLYETISGIKLGELDADDDIDSTALVYKWFSVLKGVVDNILKKSLKTIHGKGYKLCVDKEKKYYLLDFL